MREGVTAMNAETATAVKGWFRTIEWMEGVIPVEYHGHGGDLALKVLFPLAELDFLMAGLSNWGVGTYPLTNGADGPFGEVVDGEEFIIAFLA